MAIVRAQDRGAIMTYIVSPTRAVLVKENRPDARWKLPGGSIEGFDQDVTAAAIREVEEETKIRLSREEVLICSEEQRSGDSYRPHFCIAHVSEARLDTRATVGDEDGRPIEVAAFRRDQILGLADLLEPHWLFIREVETTRQCGQ